MREGKVIYKRVLFVFDRIKDGHYPNASTLAKEYEVSTKTIQRDIDFLRNNFDVPIAYDEGKFGYYLTEPTFELPALKLGEGELFAMALAEQVLEQYQNTPVYERLTRIFHKLEKHLPEKASLEANWLWGRFSMVPLPSPAINQEVWQLVFEALHNQRRLRFDYTAPPHQNPVMKVLHPYHIVVHRAQWYIIGEDEGRKAVRIFSLSRISRPKILKETFSLPEDFRLEDYIDPDMGIFMGGETFEASIHFSAKIAPIIQERTWHQNQEIDAQNDGSLILKFKTNQKEEVLYWISAWGPEATLLSPDFLVQAYQERLEKTLKNYKKS
jgi:predicted DNA-binding transcriptional regulator YafY